MLRAKYTLRDLDVQNTLRNTEERIENPEKALKECGLVLIRSISRNFKAGGRPTAWKKSKRVEKEGGQTLVKTADLKNSITMQVVRRLLKVGTAKIYAAIHNLGGEIKKQVAVKQHWRHMDQAFGKAIPARSVMVGQHQRNMNLVMPKREFIVVQDEDYRVFKRIIADHVTATD